MSWFCRHDWESVPWVPYEICLECEEVKYDGDWKGLLKGDSQTLRSYKAKNLYDKTVREGRH